MQPVDVPLPPPAADAETVRRTVAEVLARPEYADLEPGLLDRIWGNVTRAVGELLAALTGTVAGSVIGYLLLAALLVLAAFLAYRAVRGLRRESAAAVATAVDVGRDPADWLADAEEHEAGGRWRDGVRCRYRALVAALAAAGTVDEVPGRTAGEYVAAVGAAAPAASPSFATATGIFERAWYGQGDVGPTDVDAFRTAARAVTQAAGVTDGATAAGVRR